MNLNIPKKFTKIVSTVPSTLIEERNRNYSRSVRLRTGHILYSWNTDCL